MRYFSSIYDSWEKTQREKYEKMMDIVNQMDMSGQRVLDVGVGTGSFEKFLEEKGIDTTHFIGVDPDQKMLSKCTLVNKMRCKVENINLRSVDAVVCIDAIHLINDVSKMKSALKKDGYMLIAIFYNDENEKERSEMVRGLFKELSLIKKKSIDGKEKELVFLFQK